MIRRRLAWRPSKGSQTLSDTQKASCSLNLDAADDSTLRSEIFPFTERTKSFSFSVFFAVAFLLNKNSLFIFHYETAERVQKLSRAMIQFIRRRALHSQKHKNFQKYENCARGLIASESFFHPKSSANGSTELG